MAVAFESVATTAFATTNGITINKPTGLAVGDLMVAHIVIESGNTGDISRSGWTVIVEYDDSELATVLYKVADSGDVAASSFAFNTGSSVKCGGAIYRISGAAVSFTVGAFDTTTTQTSHVFDTADITPAFASSLILFLFHQFGGTASPVSNYAVVTNNPTWTEAYDFNITTGTDMGIAGAYAIRTQTTATGDASCSTSSATSGRAVLIAIPTQVSVTVTGNTGILTLTGNAGTASGNASITGSTGVLILNGNAGTVETPDPTWVNTEKSAAPDWTNTEKS